jgi:hypothetical protein
LDIKIIALVILPQPGKDENESFEVSRCQLCGELHFPDPSILHLLGKSFEDGIFIGFHQNPDIVKEKILPDDFQEEVAFGSDKGVDSLETFLGQAVDEDIIGIINEGSFEQAIES